VQFSWVHPDLFEIVWCLRYSSCLRLVISLCLHFFVLDSCWCSYFLSLNCAKCFPPALVLWCPLCSVVYVPRLSRRLVFCLKGSSVSFLGCPILNFICYRACYFGGSRCYYHESLYLGTPETHVFIVELFLMQRGPSIWVLLLQRRMFTIFVLGKVSLWKPDPWRFDRWPESNDFMHLHQLGLITLCLPLHTLEWRFTIAYTLIFVYLQSNGFDGAGSREIA
jgi:hypothetical protein